jgi:PAS domain-containing protein
VPEDVDRMRALVDEAIRKRRHFSCDYQIRLADGSVRVLHDRGGVILNEVGEPIRLVGTAQDVTEQRRVQEMLEENRRLLHMVLTTLPVGVAVTDRAEDVILANSACERIWGNVIVLGRERRTQSKGFWHDSGKRIDPEGWPQRGQCPKEKPA